MHKFKSIHKLSIPLFVLLSTFFLTNTKILAAGVTISPTIINYDVFPDTDNKQQIVIRNDNDKALKFSFTVAQISNEDHILQSRNADIDKAIKLNLTDVTIAPGKTATLQANIIIAKTFLDADYTPAIIVNITDPASNSAVNINQRIIIPVLVSFTKDVPHQLSLALLTNPPANVTGDKFNVVGNITNLQNRNFKPAARLEFISNAKLVQIVSLTELLPESLNKNEQVVFNKELSSQFLQPLQTYTINLYLTDVATNQVFVTSYQFTYIPIQLMIAAIGVVATLLVILIIIYIFFNKRRKLESTVSHPAAVTKKRSPFKRA